jgi:hypothetical protein
MRPGEFQHRVILFRIEIVAVRVYGRGYGAEKVDRKLMEAVSDGEKKRMSTPTMPTTSGHTVSVITPRWVVI